MLKFSTGKKYESYGKYKQIMWNSRVDNEQNEKDEGEMNGNSSIILPYWRYFFHFFSSLSFFLFRLPAVNSFLCKYCIDIDCEGGITNDMGAKYGAEMSRSAGKKKESWRDGGKCEFGR